MKKTYTTTIEGKDWEQCINKSFDKKKKDLKVDGFRKGQVPKDIYIKKFGIESLYMDSVDIALPTMYEKLLKNDETIIPAASPSVDIKSIDEKHLEVLFTIVSAPEVKLGKYKNLGIKKEEIKVSEEEVTRELDSLREQFAEHKLLSEKENIKKGHIVNLNFEGLIDGVAFEGGKAENYTLTIGSNAFIPGFEDALIDMKTNEEKDLNLKFPDNYHSEDLKGKDVVFKVKINNVKERILPQMDETFFKDLALPNVDNIDKLKNEIKLNITASKEREVEDKFIFECLDLVIKNSKFDIEKEIIDEEINRIIREFDEKLSMQGMNLDKYLEMTNGKIEDLKTQMEPEAKKRVSYRLVIDAVAKEEKIEIDKKDVETEIEKLSKQYNMKKAEFLKQIGGKELLEYDLKMKKAVSIITGK